MNDSVPERTNELVVGASGRFEGVYTAHWEIPRFVPGVEGRFGRRWCRLVMDKPAFAELAGAAPEAFAQDRRRVARRLEVAFEGTVLERGRFGHKGSCRYRVRVDRWRSVRVLAEDPPRPSTSVGLLPVLAVAVAGCALALSLAEC